MFFTATMSERASASNIVVFVIAGIVVAAPPSCCYCFCFYCFRINLIFDNENGSNCFLLLLFLCVCVYVSVKFCCSVTLAYTILFKKRGRYARSQSETYRNLFFSQTTKNILRV